MFLRLKPPELEILSVLHLKRIQGFDGGRFGGQVDTKEHAAVSVSLETPFNPTLNKIQTTFSDQRPCQRRIWTLSQPGL